MFSLEYKFYGSVLQTLVLTSESTIHKFTPWQDFSPEASGTSKARILIGNILWELECNNEFIDILYYRSFEQIFSIRYCFRKDSLKVMYREFELSREELGETRIVSNDEYKFVGIEKKNIRRRFEEVVFQNTFEFIQIKNSENILTLSIEEKVFLKGLLLLKDL